MALVWAALVGIAVTTACRFWTWLQELGTSTLTLAGLSGPVTAVGAALVLAGAAWARHFGTRWAAWWALAAIVPVLLVAQYARPTYAGLASADGPSSGVHLTVLAQNLWYHSREPEEQVQMLLGEDADVYVLSEFTPSVLAELRDHDVERRYPFSVIRPRPGRLGMAVLSRIPLQVRNVTKFRITVDLEPVGAVPLRLIATHSPAPSSVGIESWHRELDQLSRSAEEAGPDVVVAGDLNATSAHVAFRELAEDADLTDAQDAGGGGFEGTWNLLARVPPMQRLDHILVGRDVGIHRFRFADRIGSDHRGIVAEIVARPAEDR
ncbi:endonuclease/exonuclease/phosphatase family protein [Dermatobacter hominis]|uniref:endonuclease/exonuclease/phosphatase family protein n=1 Tax=Dermatobacter hominis TaxID=2884263 RepID=UPI001D11ECAA|nr:endonuclease/exonuclease/phosphatase family protein [Dermatobacter hominis]UDY36095.1 endonuclease/exonuclease/phosphatase family protein [Dermatobacter hominis]